MIVKLCVVFVLTCTLLRNAQGITGADPVKIEDFRYNVIVTKYPNTKSVKSYTSGSIIHRRFILTYDLYEVKVAWNADKSSVKYTIDIEMEVQVLTNHYLNIESKKNKIIEKVKTMYVPQKQLISNVTDYCISILELQNDLDLSRGIQVLKLPTTYYMEDYEKFAVFTGFGRTSTSADGLRAMEVAIVDCPKSLAACDTSTFCGGSIILHENIGNSRNQSLSPHVDDLGGPLVYRKNTIIGMAIMGAITTVDMDYRLGREGPMKFLNISHHLDFINDVISGHSSILAAPVIPPS